RCRKGDCGHARSQPRPLSKKRWSGCGSEGSWRADRRAGEPVRGACQAQETGRNLKGNVIVQVGVESSRLRARLGSLRRSAAEVVATEILVEGSPPCAATAIAAVEQLELTPEFLKDNFRRIPVVARLVGPLARLDLPFD